MVKRTTYTPFIDDIHKAIALADKNITLAEKDNKVLLLVLLTKELSSELEKSKNSPKKMNSSETLCLLLPLLS